jgi:hypothetical protein
MRLAWLVPASWDDEVWNYCRELARALPPEHSVDFWVSGKFPAMPLPGAQAVFPAATCDAGRLAEYDLCVYSLQAAPAANAVLEFGKLAQACPGVVILHGMQPTDSSETPAELLPSGAAAVEGVKWKKLMGSVEIRKFFLNARGILTFSEKVSGQFRKIFYGPVGTLPPLPVKLSGNTEVCAPAAGAKFTVAFLTNLPEADLIKCLGDLKKKFRRARDLELVLMDPHRRRDRTEKLKVLVAEVGLIPGVRVFAGKSAEDFFRQLSSADIIVHFLEPLYDTTLGWLASALSLGKPVVTGRGGFGEELPAGCARVVKPCPSRAWLAALLKLRRHAKLRQALSVQAGNWSRSQGTPAKAAAAFGDLIFFVKRQELEFRLLEHVGRELARLNVPPDMPVVKNLARLVSVWLEKP